MSEAELTPAMIEAGVREYIDWYASIAPYREGAAPIEKLVARVYRAMRQTSSPEDERP